MPYAPQGVKGFDDDDLPKREHTVPTLNLFKEKIAVRCEHHRKCARAHTHTHTHIYIYIYMLSARSRAFWCWSAPCKQLLLAFTDLDCFRSNFHEGGCTESWDLFMFDLNRHQFCDVSRVLSRGMWRRAVLYTVTDRSLLPQNGDSSSFRTTNSYDTKQSQTKKKT